jgi:nucleoside-diphosphate-sugar epimerase
MSRRKILVTGSQGFLGQALRSVLADEGCDIIGLGRPGSGAELEQDLADPAFDPRRLAEQVGPIGGTIYLAATIARTSSVDADARRNLRVIAESAVRVMEAWHDVHGPTHFVYCGTFKGYGPPKALPIDPLLPPQRPDPFSYGSAKALAERLLEISAERCGAHFAVVRSTNIYGPGQHLQNAIPLFLRAAWAGQNPVVFGRGTDLRDDVFVRDIACCLAQACLRGAEGPFHAGGERSRTILEVAKLCCRAVAELGGPHTEVVLDASRPAKWWLDMSFDIERSKKLLGYVPTPMFDGLKREAAWMRAGAHPETATHFASASFNRSVST